MFFSSAPPPVRDGVATRRDRYCPLSPPAGLHRRGAAGRVPRPAGRPGNRGAGPVRVGRDPVLAQAARLAGGVPPEEEFGQGLAIVLRGFRAMLAEPLSPTREQP